MANILIADDDQKFAGSVGRRLVAKGHACRTEGDGNAAFALVRSGAVHLLVLDVMLPGISGFEVCRRIRNSPECYGVPILMVSAMNSEEEIAHALAQGADDYVTKPASADDVANRACRLLQSESQNQRTDAVTGMLSARTIRREVQRAINARRRFSLAYVELAHLAEFARVAGAEARGKAMRHFARVIGLVSRDLELVDFAAGHLGGGHFACLLPCEQAPSYAERMVTAWEEHLPELYSALGHENAIAMARSNEAATGAIPLVQALVCVTVSEPGTVQYATALFETLTRLRESARSAKSDGIYIDRRS